MSRLCKRPCVVKASERIMGFDLGLSSASCQPDPDVRQAARRCKACLREVAQRNQAQLTSTKARQRSTGCGWRTRGYSRNPAFNNALLHEVGDAEREALVPRQGSPDTLAANRVGHVIPCAPSRGRPAKCGVPGMTRSTLLRSSVVPVPAGLRVQAPTSPRAESPPGPLRIPVRRLMDRRPIIARHRQLAVAVMTERQA